MIREMELPRRVRHLGSSGWLDDVLIRICVALQLSPSQYLEAERHYQAVARWLAASESPLGLVPQEIFPQGSLRIGTTVRPWLREEYDLDLVLLLRLRESMNPAHLLDLVEQRLRASAVYAPLVERKNRCVRLNFARQFHLDILPALPDPKLGGTNLLIPDCDAKCLKESNPKGYAGWFEKCEEVQSEMALFETKAAIQPLPLPEEAAEKSALQLDVQLLKRWRDIEFADEPNLAPISIVLTTLAGSFYTGAIHPFEAMLETVRATNRSIPAVGRLRVLNPTNQFEDLSERWDANPEAYRQFVRAMRELEVGLEGLRRDEDLRTKAKRLEAMFGESIAKSAIVEQAKAFDHHRRAGTLAVTATGALTSIRSTSTVSVQRNSFYGG